MQKLGLAGRRASTSVTRRSTVYTFASAIPSSDAAPSTSGAHASSTEPKTMRLKSIPLTPEAFKPFGQVIKSEHDGKVFDDMDAQLVLNRGTPRFYIMNLPRRGLRFHRITYHANVTQCLGGLNPAADWFMAVARPSGSLAAYPAPEDLTVFRIPHGACVKMEMGTWHAGPLFESVESMDFYNLELNDTNVVDHNTHDYRRVNGWQFEVESDA